MTATTRRQAAILSLSGVTKKDKQMRPVGPRYSVQPANFPRQLWLVWDHRLGRNLSGAELNAKNPPRFPWFTRDTAAQRIVDRLMRDEARSAALSYGVCCDGCGEYETACRCED